MEFTNAQIADKLENASVDIMTAIEALENAVHEVKDVNHPMANDIRAIERVLASLFARSGSGILDAVDTLRGE